MEKSADNLPPKKCERPCLWKNGAKNWQPASLELKDWCKLLKESLGPRIGVRIGSQSSSVEDEAPQWERKTRTEDIEIKQLLSDEYYQDLDKRNEWAYFDYKYMAEIFPKEILDTFDWSFTGLTGRGGADTTLWIGSRGAHTPCHQDSYGYNVVAQLIGSKSWILVSPDEYERMSPTRIPYEESSVYSNINFKDVSKNSPEVLSRLAEVSIYKVTLTPGDVLYVPMHWWHSVTNTTSQDQHVQAKAAVSVNTWVPCPQHDLEARLHECLVRIHAAQCAKLCTREELDILLNPNEDNLVDCDIRELVDLSEHLAQELAQTNCQPTTKYPNMDEFIPLKPMPFSSLLHLESDNMTDITATKRRKIEDNNPKRSPEQSSVFSLFKSITSRLVIESACKELINKFKAK